MKEWISQHNIIVLVKYPKLVDILSKWGLFIAVFLLCKDSSFPFAF